MFGPSLLVSIPGAQLGAVPLPGSLFGWRHLRDAVLAPELRLALALVVEAADAAGSRVRFLARPEIFTHGRARAWLDERIGDAADHLILTDGDTLRILPGLRNHMFFYTRGIPAREAALGRLRAVVPEAFAGLASQVNGTCAVRLGGRWVRPPPRGLGFRVAPAVEAASIAPFFCHPGNPDRAAAICAEAVAEPEAMPPLERPVHFIPLCRSALEDPAYLDALLRLLPRAALGGGSEVVLLGLPPPETLQATLADRIAQVLRPMAVAGMPFARVDFARLERWGVRFVTAPPAPAELRGGRITLHPASPFWRLGADLYGAAVHVELQGSGWLPPLRKLLADWLGPDVSLRRPERIAGTLEGVP